jgi:hypothetical protein
MEAGGGEKSAAAAPDGARTASKKEPDQALDAVLQAGRHYQCQI